MLDIKKMVYGIFFFSIVSILFAFYLQYILGHAPCKLCIYQRVPYYLIIAIGLINLLFNKYLKFSLFLISILLLSELFISGYHTLSTFGIIEYTGCESATLPTDINQLKEALLNDSLVVTCSNANLKFFGIPLSLYNTLFSAFFLLIIILNAYKKKK
jgi:disulfide bond formation protein DsbB